MDEKGFMSDIFMFLYLVLIIGSLIALCYISWLEYKDWQDTKQLIREHNGTCIDKGYAVECGYKESYKIINSNSQCYKEDIKINCSEIGQ